MALDFRSGSHASIDVLRDDVVIGRILSDGRYYPFQVCGLNSSLSCGDVLDLSTHMLGLGEPAEAAATG